jgi:hypothetical protein
VTMSECLPLVETRKTGLERLACATAIQQDCL